MDDITRKCASLSLNTKEAQTVSLAPDVVNNSRILVARLFTKRRVNMEALVRTLKSMWRSVQNFEKNPANEPRRRRATPTNLGADEPKRRFTKPRRTQAPISPDPDEPSNTDGEARRIQAPILTKSRRKFQVIGSDQWRRTRSGTVRFGFDFFWGSSSCEVVRATPTTRLNFYTEKLTSVESFSI
nr:hypothetical protein CFP56_03488 [Quercus suber]